MPRTKPNVSWTNRIKPEAIFTERVKPTATWTNRTKPNASFTERTKPLLTFDFKVGMLIGMLGLTYSQNFTGNIWTERIKPETTWT